MLCNRIGEVLLGCLLIVVTAGFALVEGHRNEGPRAYHVRSGSHNLTIVDWSYYMDFADTLWPISN